MKIFEQAGIDRMQLYLDYASRKQQMINSNIANIDTPGYQAKELTFEHLFREASVRAGLPLKTSLPGHLPGKPRLLREDAELRAGSTGALGNDLNNVDMDREMTELAQNVLKFSAVAQLVQMKLAAIRSAIRGN